MAEVRLRGSDLEWRRSASRGGEEEEEEEGEEAEEAEEEEAEEELKDPSMEFLSRSWSASALGFPPAPPSPPPEDPQGMGNSSFSFSFNFNTASASSASSASATSQQLVMERIMSQSQSAQSQSPLTSGRLSHSSGPLNLNGSLGFDADSPPALPLSPSQIIHHLKVSLSLYFLSPFTLFFSLFTLLFVLFVLYSTLLSIWISCPLSVVMSLLLEPSQQNNNTGFWLSPCSSPLCSYPMALALAWKKLLCFHLGIF